MSESKANTYSRQHRNWIAHFPSEDATHRIVRNDWRTESIENGSKKYSTRELARFVSKPLKDVSVQFSLIQAEIEITTGGKRVPVNI